MDIEEKLDTINKDMSRILKYYDWSRICLNIMVGIIVLMVINLLMMLFTIMFNLEWFTHRQLLDFSRSLLIVHIGNALIHQVLQHKVRKGQKRIDDEYRPFLRQVERIVKEHGKKED